MGGAVFRIGDFSRIARVSCRLLRYYEEIGLLAPARVERDTGYRYYSAAQLPQLNRILVLKEMGFSLEQIGPIIGERIPAEQLRAMLTLRRADAARAAQQELDRLRHIETRIAQIDSAGSLAFDDVVLRAQPAQKIVSIRRVLASFAEAQGVIGELQASVARRLRAGHLGNLVAIAHAAEFEPERLDVEFGFLLSLDTAVPTGLVAAGLCVRELPAQARMATCVRVGLPEHAHLVTARIGGFIESNGFELDGPSREVFLQPPRPDRMQDSVIEMQYPIRPRQGAGNIPTGA